MNEKRILVAYFSRSGNNYINGKIMNLPVGNTEVLANLIVEITKGNIFRIDTMSPYPSDYEETIDVAGKELREKERPKLSDRVQDINFFNVFLLGYPNWWGTIPMPVATFLSENDLSRKTIAPFCTNEGSGIGRSVADIKELCPKSAILDGLAIRGSNVKSAGSEVLNWLREIKVVI